MGINSALTPFTADDYPGAGLRNLNTDGIWVLFQLDEAPEPGTGLLLGIGLLGLGSSVARAGAEPARPLSFSGALSGAQAPRLRARQCSRFASATNPSRFPPCFAPRTADQKGIGLVAGGSARMRTATRILLGLLVGVFAGPPPMPGLHEISGISIVMNAGNTTDFTDDSGTSTARCTERGGVLASAPTSFATRYAAVVSADLGGATGGTTTRNLTGKFHDLLLGDARSRATRGTSRSSCGGSARRRSSATGTGMPSVILGAITGSLGGAGSMSRGSIGLGALTTHSRRRAEDVAGLALQPVDRNAMVRASAPASHRR